MALAIEGFSATQSHLTMVGGSDGSESVRAGRLSGCAWCQPGRSGGRCNR